MSRFHQGFLATAALVLACLLPPSNAKAGAASPPLPTFDEISAVTSSRNKGLKSLFVEFRMRGKLLGAAEDAKRYLELVALIDETKAFAFSRNMRYISVNRPSDHYEDIAPAVSLDKPESARSRPPQPTREFDKVLEGIHKDLERNGRKPPVRFKAGSIQVEPEKCWRFDGELLSTWYGIEKPRLHLMGRPYTSANSDDRSCFDQTYLWVVFHSIPDAFHPDRDRGEHRLPDAFSKFKARIRPAPEVIDGASCIVIELGNRFVLWCDPKLDYSVRRWDSLEGTPGQVTDRFELRDLTEVSPRMWLPRKAVWKRWAPPDAPEPVRRGPLMQYLIDVLNIHANDVPDVLFNTDMKKVPKGTLIVDNINTIRDKNGNDLATNYKIPADVGKLNQAIASARDWQVEEWKRRETRTEVRGGSKLTAPARSPRRLWFLGVNLAVCASILFFLSIRSRRNRLNDPGFGDRR